MLDQKSVDSFIERLGNVGPLIRTIMDKEDWVVQDNDELSNIIEEIGRELAQASADELSSISEDEWVLFLSLIDLPRFILTLQCMEEKLPRVTIDLLEFDKEREKKHIFPYLNATKSRINTLYQRELICRIFNPSRIEALEDYLNKSSQVY